MHEWLDQETRSLLRKHPPEKRTVSGEETYALVLLERGPDSARIDDAISAVGSDWPVSSADLPFIVARGLSLEEAFVGQFALACCDCAVSFVPDESARRADRWWWRRYYAEVMKSGDFQKVVVQLMQIPPGEEGRQYCWQFVGMATVPLPMMLSVFRIKAELMEYWANRLGATLRRRPDQRPPGDSR